MMQMSWQQLAKASDLEAFATMVVDLMANRIADYSGEHLFSRGDGSDFWGKLRVSCIEDSNGHPEYMIGQVADVTEEVRTRQTLKAELESAAGYLRAILPGDLDGPARVTSRYLPARELGGDCFDYTWIDDDHLLMYLIDVSGHGLEPALLAVSLQNMLRSGSFGKETLLEPAAVLAELNRLFQMEQQSDHYFTMWYGVYAQPTRTLRFVSAGTPPAYAFNSTPGSGLTATELTTNGIPVGIFEDADFVVASYTVPQGCQMLLYSDGASEQMLAGGEQLSLKDFKKLTTRLAESPDWSLDELVEDLRDLTPASLFEDDCSLIRVAFN
jgi:sigma-B regulation protein RsbU (phosphoserine phosphatase)